MKIQSAVLKILGAVAALALLSGSGFAQTAECAGRAISNAYGRGCATPESVPPITNQDYGVVRVQFTPPSRTDDVIPANELRGTWLEAAGARLQGRTSTAVVLLEMRAIGDQLPRNADERGVPQGVLIATVPLAVYEYDGREKLKFRQVQEFADRVIGPRLLIRDDQTIQAHLRVVFTQQDAGSVIAEISRVASTAASLTGTQGGFIVHALANQTAMADIRAIEQRIQSVQGIDSLANDTIDLSFARNTRLVYDFSLNPTPPRRIGRNRSQPRPQGNLVVTLERRPSMLTQEIFAGAPGQALPNYGAGDSFTALSTRRVWQTNIAPEVNADAIVQRPVIKALYDVFQRETTTPQTFNDTCVGLRDALMTEGAGLSDADQAALFWAAFARTPNATRPDLRETQCIAGFLPLWQQYRLPLPATRDQPRVPTTSEVDEWIDVVAGPAIAQGDPQYRYRMVLRLFAPEVQVNIAPNTIFEAGEEPAPNAVVRAGELASRLKLMRVGCRFFPPEAQGHQRFNILGRDPATDRLYTLTVDYQGRRGGGTTVEVAGLGLRPTTDADFALLRAQRPNDARCLAPATAPIEQATAAAATPTPTPPPTPAPHQ